MLFPTLLPSSVFTFPLTPSVLVIVFKKKKKKRRKPEIYATLYLFSFLVFELNSRGSPIEEDFAYLLDFYNNNKKTQFENIIFFSSVNKMDDRGGWGKQNDRPSTTSSCDSLAACEMNEFVSDIKVELVEKFGAAGRITTTELSCALTIMGLESNENLVNSIWKETSQPDTARLPIQDILLHIDKCLRAATPSDCSTPSTSQSRRSKKSEAPSILWWGIQQPIADSV